MRFIAIGDIVSAHGIKGGVRVYLYNTTDPLLLKLKSVYAGSEDEKKLFQISRVRRVDERFCIVNFDTIITRKEADLYRGKKIYITSDMLPPLPEDQVYLSLLIGYCVFDEKGQEIGVVEDFINNGAHDIMIVKRICSTEFLVPFVDEFIKKVDTMRCQIVINVMEGLLD